jgi:branched-subunit amino acid aminotransferase/4-amino-4-deoxychorismate lyase
VRAHGRAFEGLKAYAADDGSGDVLLFRPELNLARFNASLKRLRMPTFDAPELLVSALAVCAGAATLVTAVAALPPLAAAANLASLLRGAVTRSQPAVLQRARLDTSSHIDSGVSSNLCWWPLTHALRRRAVSRRRS